MTNVKSKQFKQVCRLLKILKTATMKRWYYFAAHRL